MENYLMTFGIGAGALVVAVMLYFLAGRLFKGRRIEADSKDAPR